MKPSGPVTVFPSADLPHLLSLIRLTMAARCLAHSASHCCIDVGWAAVVAVLAAEVAVLAVRSVESAQWRQQEELATAALHMGRAQEAAAERDHELRNGLAGLAGITHLLSDDTGSPDHERLRHAVLAELGRLHAILDGGLPDALPDVDYAVEPVLAGLVALRADARVTLSVAPDLHLRGDPAVLAQIVTNLLVNCARHAPGADVAVTARSRQRGGVDRGARHGSRVAAGGRTGRSTSPDRASACRSAGGWPPRRAGYSSCAR